jgi:membrane protease YdiL (CAAX protease family)
VTFGRRRSLLVLLVTLVVVAVLTGRAFDAPYGSARVTHLSYGIAAVLVAGSVLSGGLSRGHRRGRHPVVGPVLSAFVLFLFFVVLAWLAHVVPPLHHGARVLRRYGDARHGFVAWWAPVVAGVAEEVFYRGALFERLRAPVVTTTFAHVLTTLPAGNVALTASAFVLGPFLGASRRTSGGWWAPAATHAVWTMLVLAWLPR